LFRNSILLAIGAATHEVAARSKSVKPTAFIRAGVSWQRITAALNCCRNSSRSAYLPFGGSVRHPACGCRAQHLL